MAKSSPLPGSSAALSGPGESRRPTGSGSQISWRPGPFVMIDTTAPTSWKVSAKEIWTPLGTRRSAARRALMAARHLVHKSRLLFRLAPVFGGLPFSKRNEPLAPPVPLAL